MSLPATLSENTQSNTSHFLPDLCLCLADTNAMTCKAMKCVCIGMDAGNVTRGIKPLSPPSFLLYRPLYVFRVAEVDTVCETDVVSAGRIKTLFHPLITEVALLGDAVILIKPDCAIRAGLHTATAARETAPRLLNGDCFRETFLDFVEVVHSLPGL